MEKENWRCDANNIHRNPHLTTRFVWNLYADFDRWSARIKSTTKGKRNTNWMHCVNEFRSFFPKRIIQNCVGREKRIFPDVFENVVSLSIAVFNRLIYFNERIRIKSKRLRIYRMKQLKMKIWKKKDVLIEVCAKLIGISRAFIKFQFDRHFPI